VVDVSLYPDSVDLTDLGDKHSYAAWWYTGSGEPALAGNRCRAWASPGPPCCRPTQGPPARCPGYRPTTSRTGTSFSHPADKQFVLDARSSSPSQNYTFASAASGRSPSSRRIPRRSSRSSAPGALLRLHGHLVRLPVHVVRARRRADDPRRRHRGLRDGPDRGRHADAACDDQPEPPCCSRSTR